MSTFRIQGQVLGEDGRALGGAHVRLEPGRLSALSTNDGAFSFEVVEPRTYSLSATKADYYAQGLLVRPEELSEPTVLRMRHGVTLLVYVFANGAPLAGARLVLDYATMATTDVRGTATIRGLAPGHYRGRLFADGCATEIIEASILDDPGGIVERFVTMERGAHIEGVVLDPDGQPVENAWVVITGRPPTGNILYDDASATNGRWGVVARAGKYQVRATKKENGASADLAIDCDGQTPQRDLVLRVPARATPEPFANLVDAGERLVTLGSSMRIAGTIVDDEGQPAARARVRVASPSQAGRSITMNRWMGETDARGRFDVEGLDDAEYDVFYGWSREGEHSQRVRAGKTDLKLILPTGASAIGHVLLDGKPLPYFGFRLLSERENPSGGSPTGVRSVDGRFTLRHIPPGKWRIALLGPGTRMKTTDEFAVGGNETVDIGEIAMTRGYRLAGHVRHKTGSGVACARVIVGRMSKWAQGRSRLEQWFMGQYETTTDAEGAYSFDGLDTHREPMCMAEIVRATHVSAGASLFRELPKTDTKMDFFLLGSGRIEGIVENLRGGFTSVVALRPDEPTFAHRSTVEMDGTFEFEDLAPGEYVVRADLQGNYISSVTVTVVANQTTRAQLAMTSPSVHLTLRVPLHRAKDVVIEPVSYDAGLADRIRGISTTGSEDLVHLHHVQPGVYRVSLDGKRWTEIAVAVSPAEQTLDLRYGLPL